MADNKIEIGVEVTGAEESAQQTDEVAKSIFKVEDAGKQASRQADVDSAKAKQTSDAAAEQAAALEKVAESQQRILALNLAQAVGLIGEKFKGLSPEIDLVVSSSQNFLNVFAATGDPIRASLALTATAIGGVYTAYQQAAEQAKNIAKQEQDDIKRIGELRRQYASEVRAENLVTFFQGELTELEKQEQALLRIVKIRASERDLAAAQQALAGKQAVQNGADPNAVAAQNQETATANKVKALEDALTAAQAAFDKAQSSANLAKSKAEDLVKLNGEGDSEAKKAAAASDSAQKALETATENLETLKGTIPNQIKQAITEGQSAVTDISAAGLSALTAVVTKERDALQAEVDKEGAKASSNAKAALETLNKILADNQISADETKQLADAQNRVRGSQEISNAALKEAFEQTAKTYEGLIQIIQPIMYRLQMAEAKLEGMTRW